MMQGKMLSLMALAFVIMVFAGPGTASATVCSTAGTGAACGAGHGHIYTGTSHATLNTETKVTFTTGFITYHCTGSTVQGEVTNDAGEGKITNMTFTGCTNTLDNTACTASTTASISPFGVKTTGTGGGNGTMTVTNITMEFTCSPFGIEATCKYTASDAGSTGEIVVTGGEPAKITATKVPLAKEEVSSGSCSNIATWSGAYTVTTPGSGWIE